MKKILPFFILGFLLFLNFSQALTYMPRGRYDEDFFNTTIEWVNSTYGIYRSRLTWELIGYQGDWWIGSTGETNIDKDIRGLAVQGLYGFYGHSPPSTFTATIQVPNDDRIEYVFLYLNSRESSGNINTIYITDANGEIHYIKSSMGEGCFLINVYFNYYYSCPIIYKVKDIPRPYNLTFSVGWGNLIKIFSVQFLDSEMRVIDNQEFSETTRYFTDFSTSNPFILENTSNVQIEAKPEYIILTPPLKYHPYWWLTINYNTTGLGRFNFVSNSSYYDLRGRNWDIYRIDISQGYLLNPLVNKTVIYIYNVSWDTLWDKATKIELTPDEVNVYLIDRIQGIIDGESGIKTGNLQTLGDIGWVSKLVYYRTDKYARLIAILGNGQVKLIDIPYRLTTSFNWVTYWYESENANNNYGYLTDFMISLGAVGLSEAKLVSNKYEVYLYETFTLTASWKGGTPPFQLSFYYFDGSIWREFAYYPEYYERSISTDVSWSTVGNYSFKVRITDSTGASIETNTITIRVLSPPVPFTSPHTSINDVEGVPYAPPINITVSYPFTLRVRIWNMSGGFPPYTVYFKLFGYDVFACYNVNEYGECYKEVSSDEIPFDLLTSICYSYNATHNICQNMFLTNTTDSRGIGYLNYWHYVWVLIPKTYVPLRIYLDIFPRIYINSNTSTKLTAYVSGGIPPIRLIFYHDYGRNVLCDETLVTTNTNKSLEVYWTAGAHNIFAKVYSSDQQEATSNSIDIQVNPVEPKRYKILVYNCTGTFSGPITNSESDSFALFSPTKPLASEEEWKNLGIAWALPLTTPIFILTIVALGVSGFIAMKIGGNYAGLIFAIAMLFFVIIYSITGVYPIWISVILIILTAGLIAYFIKGMF